MEKALFVIENRLVTVEEMIDFCGIEKTRKQIYHCADEKCRIKVHPSIPDKTKKGRRTAPGAYFSRRSGPEHDKFCRIGMKKGKNIPADVEVLPPDKSVISSISEIPRKFVDDSPPLIYKNKIVRRKSKSHQNYHAKYGRRSKRYFFNRRTREVKTLVRVYETYPKKMLQASPLHISDSPAKTFFNAFKSVKLLSHKYDKQNSQNRFVYFGIIRGFEKVESGLVIRLSERSRDEKSANIF